MWLVSNIERWYLDFVRVFMLAVVVLSVLAVVAAGGLYAYVWISSEEYRHDDFLTAPAWSELRRSVLPLRGEEPAQCSLPGLGDACEEEVDDGGRGRVEIDPKVRQIGDHLNAQFTRNAGRETAFTDAYPRRALEAWIKRDAAIPDHARATYMDALVEVSKSIGEDERINRIGSVNDRVAMVFKSLVAFRDEFARRAREADARVMQANRDERDAFDSGVRYSMIIAGAGLLALFSLAIVVVLMRIELHLRRMSDASDAS